MPRRSLTPRLARCLAVALAIAVRLAAASAAAAPDPNARGLELLAGGEPFAAGLAWLAAAEQQAREESSPAALRHAALSAVLATIAFERAGDGRAYYAWSQSVRWWLEAGTSWETERAAFKRRGDELGARLRGAEGAAGAPRPAPEERPLLALSAATGFADYPGPRPGLPPPREAVDAPVPVQRDYFARPLAVAAPPGPPPEAAATPPAPATGPLGQGFPSAGVEEPAPPPPAPPPAPGASPGLTAADLAAARTAWRYFVAARQEKTGLYDSVHGYPFATVWDLGSGLAGLVAAEQLGLVTRARFRRDAGRLLATLLTLPLYRGELPNREYQTGSGRMADLANRPSSAGSGWSALDIGRLLIWLRIAADWHPELRPLAARVVKRLDFSRLAAGGKLHGAMLGKSGEELNQEGRLGYEQYAAAGYACGG